MLRMARNLTERPPFNVVTFFKVWHSVRIDCTQTNDPFNVTGVTR